MVDQTVSHFGRVDVLFNNAGLTNRKPALQATSEDWYKLFQVNLLGVFSCAQAVGGFMVQQRKGKIINSASTVGVRGDLNRSIYASTKGGVIQLTKVLANEWGKYNIQVKALGPGFMMTPLTADLLSDPEVASDIVKKIPLGRIGFPEDLIGAIDPEGPFGAKGVGEPGPIPTAPAIANAIYNAVGVRIRELPITPEKILDGLKKKLWGVGGPSCDETLCA